MIQLNSQDWLITWLNEYIQVIDFNGLLNDTPKSYQFLNSLIGHKWIHWPIDWLAQKTYLKLQSNQA